MKNYVILGLACLVVALVFGFQPVQKFMNEAFNKGTLMGVENCISYSGSELLSEDAVKATCVTAFQKPLYWNESADGKAGPKYERNEIHWEGGLKNSVPDHVTTWIKLSVELFDEEGNSKQFTGETSIWIDPLSEAEFSIELPDLEPEQLEDLDYCEQDEEDLKSCFFWALPEIKGLSI